MTTLGAAEFKASCLKVLEQVRRTGEAVTITKRGKAIARLVPAMKVGSAPAQRSLRGTVEIVGDIVAPVLPSTAWDASRAGGRSRVKAKRKRRAR